MAMQTELGIDLAEQFDAAALRQIAETALASLAFLQSAIEHPLSTEADRAAGRYDAETFGHLHASCADILQTLDAIAADAALDAEATA